MSKSSATAPPTEPGTNAATRPLLEVCVGDVLGAEIAHAAGADRLELCAALDIGGLTPSQGLMQAVGALDLPVIALIRPRDGGFCYSDAELNVMQHDIRSARAAGLRGVAIGVLDRDDRLDVSALHALIDAAGEGMELVLHRAFDLTPDPMAALEQAIALGFHRILTSGQATSAPQGAALIAQLITAAQDRIAILPGGGISAHNAPSLLATTKARALHASCSVTCAPLPARAPLRAFGFLPATGARQTQADSIKALRAAMDTVAPG